jgi:hypothetical protein
MKKEDYHHFEVSLTGLLDGEENEKFECFISLKELPQVIKRYKEYALGQPYTEVRKKDVNFDEPYAVLTVCGLAFDKSCWGYEKKIYVRYFQ